MISYPGIQNDEALFAVPIYSPSFYAKSLSSNVRLPLMLMSYLGTVKTGLYTPILNIWQPSATSIRLPALLLGALTAWLFYLFLEEVAGWRAGLFGITLLATDASFLMTTVLDWGPVVIQHLMLVAGLLAVHRFYQIKCTSTKPGAGGLRLFLGFFLFGLGMWDKALFSWILIALAVATVLVFPRELARSISRHYVPLALLAFCLGAMPLVLYNIDFPLATIRTNSSFTFNELGIKFAHFRSTLNGSGLFGYLVKEDHEQPARQPATGMERLSRRISDAAGAPRSGWSGWALLGCALALPLVWRTPARRPVLFALVFLVAGWFQMAITRGAGASVHHAVLLWPLPYVVIAVTLAAARSAWARATVCILIVFLCGTNLLVANEYLAKFIRNGAAGSWTDAIMALSGHLTQPRAGWVAITDWGMFDNLVVLHKGRLPLALCTDPLTHNPPTQLDRNYLRGLLANPENLFVAHTDAYQEFPNVNRRLSELSAEMGYTRKLEHIIRDRNGRPVFELLRFAPVR